MDVMWIGKRATLQFVDLDTNFNAVIFLKLRIVKGVWIHSLHAGSRSTLDLH